MWYITELIYPTHQNLLQSSPKPQETTVQDSLPREIWDHDQIIVECNYIIPRQPEKSKQLQIWSVHLKFVFIDKRFFKLFDQLKDTLSQSTKFKCTLQVWNCLLLLVVSVL
jgi:hypothetical protein